MTPGPLPRVVTLTLNPALDLHEEVAEPRLHALNRASRGTFEPSGKGINVARALHELGLEVTAVAPLGGPLGRLIREALEAQGLSLRACAVAGETRLNVKIADRAGRTTEFNLPGSALSGEEQRRVWDALRSEARPGSWVVLAGSLPPGVPATLYGDWTRALQAQGATVLLDAGGEALRGALASGPFLIKPNREEAQAALGSPIRTRQDALDAARRLRELGARQVALSLGAQGALLLGEEAVFATPPEVVVRSTVGCGDALLAGLIASLRWGRGWQGAARFATAYAAARAQHGGPAFGAAGRAQPLLDAVQLVGAAEQGAQERGVELWT